LDTLSLLDTSKSDVNSSINDSISSLETYYDIGQMYEVYQNNLSLSDSVVLKVISDFRELFVFTD
jgi:hypothetical protein